MKLKDKVAIVTGSTRGIGKATALLFAAEGARVVVSGTNVEAGAAVVGEIEAAGGKAVFQKTDVSDDASLTALVDAALAAYGRIDVLVNNAGIGGGLATISDITNEDWDKVIEVNLSAPFRLCKKVVPLMEAQGGGVIVNVASMASTAAGRGGLIYTTAKHGLLGFTRQLSFDNGKNGIRANAVLPGPIDTDMIARVLAVPQHPVSMKVKMSPSGRPGQPGEVAKAILFLASDDSSFIHGAGLAVDGGYTIF